jgi:hypothetical protein
VKTPNSSIAGPAALARKRRKQSFAAMRCNAVTILAGSE